MKQHRWAKEIKAWADGAEIEMWHKQYGGWGTVTEPRWYDDYKYRIKPQPKEPQYLYVYKRINGTGESYSFESTDNQSNPHWIYIGKIKLEQDDE